MTKIKYSALRKAFLDSNMRSCPISGYVEGRPDGLIKISLNISNRNTKVFLRDDGTFYFDHLLKGHMPKNLNDMKGFSCKLGNKCTCDPDDIYCEHANWNS